MDDYPSVLPMPDESGMQSSKTGRKKVGGIASSARRSAGATSRWSASTSNKKASGPTYISGPRILVFVIGGATYSELRVCRDITETQGREVILGTTAFISSNDFISDLTKLSQQSLS